MGLSKMSSIGSLMDLIKADLDEKKRKALSGTFAERVAWWASEAIDGPVNLPLFAPHSSEELQALQAEDSAQFAECIKNLEEARDIAKVRAAKDAEWRRQDGTLDRLQTAGVCIPDGCMDKLVQGTLDVTESVQAARGWWENREAPWLLLSGGTGCGKTVAAADRVAEYGGLWIRADDVVRAFAGLFGDAVESQERIKKTPFLVIDDVGSEMDSARMLPALLELLDTRCSAQRRPTLCTSNLSKKEFAARYANERLNSRMRELVSWVSLNGKDLRQKKTQRS